MKNNGVKDGELSMDDEALRNIVRLYTREAGVRAFERLISKICRKVVKELLTSKDITRVDVTVDNLDKYLGVYQFRYGRAEEKNQIGQVTGLAWTEVGGELLTIESALAPGKGKLTQTGSLGNVKIGSATCRVRVCQHV